MGNYLLNRHRIIGLEELEAYFFTHRPTNLWSLNMSRMLDASCQPSLQNSQVDRYPNEFERSICIGDNTRKQKRGETHAQTKGFIEQKKTTFCIKMGFDHSIFIFLALFSDDDDA